MIYKNKLSPKTTFFKKGVKLITRAASLVLAAALLMVFFVSCSGNGGADVLYRNDLTAAELAAEAAAGLSNRDGMIEADAEYISNHIIGAVYNEAVVSFSINSLIDEYGIFRCEPPVEPTAVVSTAADSTADTTAAVSAADEMAAVLENYLKTTLENFMVDCMEESEHSKLKKAEVRVFGCYAVYAILPDAERKDFFKKIGDILAAK